MPLIASQVKQSLEVEVFDHLLSSNVVDANRLLD